jgi:hypothetical protein
LETHPIFSNILAEKIKNGGIISEMHFISHELPKDSSEHDFSNKKKDILKIENLNRFVISFKGKSKESLISVNKDKVNAIIQGISDKLINPREKVFYEGIDAPLDQIKIVIELNGKIYPIVFDKDGENFRESLYLDPKEIISEGLILHDKVYAICEKYAQQILQKSLNK